MFYRSLVFGHSKYSLLFFCVSIFNIKIMNDFLFTKPSTLCHFFCIYLVLEMRKICCILYSTNKWTRIPYSAVKNPHLYIRLSFTINWVFEHIALMYIKIQVKQVFSEDYTPDAEQIIYYNVLFILLNLKHGIPRI